MAPKKGKKKVKKIYMKGPDKIHIMGELYYAEALSVSAITHIYIFCCFLLYTTISNKLPLLK